MFFSKWKKAVNAFCHTPPHLLRACMKKCCSLLRVHSVSRVRIPPYVKDDQNVSVQTICDLVKNMSYDLRSAEMLRTNSSNQKTRFSADLLVTYIFNKSTISLERNIFHLGHILQTVLWFVFLTTILMTVFFPQEKNIFSSLFYV